MTEQERVDAINKQAVVVLHEVLVQLEGGTLREDVFLAETYARLVAACALGYDPKFLVEDALAAAERLNELVEDHET